MGGDDGLKGRWSGVRGEAAVHGRVLFLLGGLLAKNTPSQPVVASSKSGFRNFLGPLDEGDRYTAGGLLGPGGSDDELRLLMQKLARRIWQASEGHKL